MKKIITIAIMAFSLSVVAQNTWTNVGLGFNGQVRVFLADPANNKLYAGGSFTMSGTTSVNYVAVWDGIAWSPLGTGMNNYVEALAFYQGELIAGGQFTQASGASANGVAKWDGSNWQAVGSGFSGSTVPGGAVVTCFAVYNGELYAGGDFLDAGGTTVNHIAKWDGSAWVAVGSGISNSSATKYLNDMIVYNNELYVGGIFDAVNGVSASYIAKYNGTTWSAVGSGLNDWAGKFLVNNGNLIVGGNFTTAGGSTANYIASYDGSTWSTLGSGMNDWISELTYYNQKIFAGGEFTTADGSSSLYISQWDGSDWSSVGGGTNGIVAALSAYGNSLIAGGTFTQAGTTTVGYVAKYVSNVSDDECFSSPDGIEYVQTAGWSYKDYVIPAGFRVDSVYGDFDRSGYPVNEHDFALHYCGGVDVYDQNIATMPFDYMTESTSLYDRWIDLTSFNYLSVGVIRVFLPTNAGAVWNDLCFAISPSSTTCTETIYDTVTVPVYVYDTTAITVTDTLVIDIPVGINPTTYNTLKCYPNPASDHLIIDNGNYATMGGFTLTIENSLGQQVFSSLVNQQTFNLDLTTWGGNGLYFVKVIDPSSNVIDIRKVVLQ